MHNGIILRLFNVIIVFFIVKVTQKHSLYERIVFTHTIFCLLSKKTSNDYKKTESKMGEDKLNTLEKARVLEVVGFFLNQI